MGSMENMAKAQGPMLNGMHDAGPCKAMLTFTVKKYKTRIQISPLYLNSNWESRDESSPCHNPTIRTLGLESGSHWKHVPSTSLGIRSSQVD